MTTWQLDDHAATFIDAGWRLHFQAIKPQLGLQCCHGEAAQPDALLIDLPGAQSVESISDCYARGSDLVVAYEQHAHRTVGPQIYLRVLEASEATCVVQLIVSMQTSLLDSDPTCTVASESGEGELFRDSSGQWSQTRSTTSLARVKENAPDGVSFFDAIHPSDYFESIAPAEQARRFGFRVFSESLEKGVIRRARILAGWTTREDPVECAEYWFQQQAQEAPPLTT